MQSAAEDKSKLHGSANTSEATLNLNLIGNFDARVQQNRILIPSKKGQAVLSFLALSPKGIASREQLRQLLWANSTENRAQSSLRHTLWKINQSLDNHLENIIHATRQEIILDLNRAKIDARDIIESLLSGNPHRRLIQEPFLFENLLQGLEQSSEEFCHWVSGKRVEYQRQVLPGLQLAVAHHSNNPKLQLPTLELITHLDPLNEPATRALMRARCQQGDVAGALEAYQNLCVNMDAQQGMEPCEQTQAIAVDIKTGQQNKTHTDLNKKSDKPCIYLREQKTCELKSEHQALLTGFQQEMLGSLIRFREWCVIDAESAPWTNATDEKQGAYELSISPFTFGECLRLIVTLKDLASGSFLWSEKVEHSEQDWQSSQSFLVKQLAHSLNVHVCEQRISQLASRDQFSLSAYDSWLLAESKIITFEKAAWEEAKEILRHLMHSQRNFPRTYSSLAQMDNAKHFVFPGLVSNPERRQRALSYARRSVELDPQDSRNQLCLGWGYAMKGQHLAASKAFGQAIVLNENDPWTATSAAMGLAFCGEIRTAHTLAQQTLSIDLNPAPLHWAYHATISFIAADYAQCISFTQLAESSMTDVLAWRAAAYAQSGDAINAALTLQEFRRETKKKWYGKHPPCDREIALWILSCFPIKSRKAWIHLRDGLAISGLQCGDAPFPLGSI